MCQLYIGVTGENRGGKDTLYEEFCLLYPNLKVAQHRASDVLLEIIHERGWETTRQNFDKVVAELQEKEGPAALTNRVAKRILAAQEKVVFFNGVRLITDVAFFRTLPQNSLVYVTADERTRWLRARAAAAKAGEANVSFEDFLKIDKLPTNRHVPTIGRDADWIIENIGTKAEFKQKIADTIAGIMSSKLAASAV